MECPHCLRGYVYDSYRDVVTSDRCRECFGTGIVQDTSCSTCKGNLTITIRNENALQGEYPWKSISCPECNS